MDVFISYSSKDRAIAEAACAALEGAGFDCWIAPRNIQPGADWGTAIIGGIESSRLFVLVFTKNANASPQVLREVERAVAKGLPIVPFRVEDVQPTKGLEYFISSQHWLDASSPPLKRHLGRLAQSARALLRAMDDAATNDGATREAPSSQAGELVRSPKIRTMMVSSVVAALALLAAVGTWMMIVALRQEPATPSVSEPASAETDSTSAGAMSGHDPLFARTIRERFQQWDEDRDGKLSVAEIRRCLANWKGPVDQLLQTLKRIDRDGDSAISEDELLGIGRDLVEHRDADGDGRYTVAEFLARNRADGGDAPFETVTTVFGSEDANHDGYVTVPEMEQWILVQMLGGN